MTTSELLQQVGLNKYEAEAYYTLLSQGPLTGYELGKRSPVPLSRSYEVLGRLAQKGLALTQPGDPPRYRAISPTLFLDRIQATMTETLTALTEALISLPHVDITGEFWVILGRQHILERAQAMLAEAQSTFELLLPEQQDPDIVRLLTVAQTQKQRVGQIRRPTLSADRTLPLWLLIDGREALVGTLTPPEQCQAVVSTNAALITLLNHAFRDSPDGTRPVPSSPGKAVQQATGSLDWIAWEERKQRHLWNVNAGNFIA